MKQLSRTEARDKIDNFFKDAKGKNKEEIKKKKEIRIIMDNPIKSSIGNINRITHVY